jgi:signal transduction histidine kinase
LNETLEERVEKRTQQVRNLASALTLAEQRERRRIAQILHDDLQQLLSTRTLAIDLSPPVLQGEGLDAAIAWLSNQMKELHDLEVSIELFNPCLMAERDMRVLLYQLVRELLFNVVKHANTNRVYIRCGSQDGQIIITVEDQGKGFDLEAATQKYQEEGHFGLFSIRERLMLLGGNLKIETAPGQGTRVTITAPCHSSLSARTALEGGSER